MTRDLSDTNTQVAGFVEHERYRPEAGVRTKYHLFTARGEVRLDDRPGAMVSVAHFLLPNIVISEVRSTGHQVDVQEVSALSLVAPTTGTVCTDFRGQSFRCPPGHLVVLPPGQRSTRAEAPENGSFLGHAVIIPTALLSDHPGREKTLFGRDELPGLHAIMASGSDNPAVARLLEFFAQLCRDITDGARAIRTTESRAAWETLLLDKVLDVVLPGLVPDWETESDKSLRITVDRALDFMNGNFATIETISEVAVGCGVGARALEVAFRKKLEMTPSEALRQIRLEAARRMLILTPSYGVTKIATACGFAHLSRFAQIYRDRFGELPSETAKR